MHKTPIQIRFSDIDMIGHVNNVAYGHFFDMARLMYFEQALGEQVDWRIGKILVLVHIETDYFQSVRLYDKIEVTTTVTGIGNKSLKMLQQIIDAEGNVKVESRCVMSTFDNDTNNSFPFPEAWREKITTFEK